MLFYNKDVFDRAGVPYPKGDWTWDEFLSTCRRLTKRRANGRGVETYGAYGLELRELIWQNGGHVFSPEGTRCVVNSPAAVEAARWYVDLFAREHVAPSPAEEAAMATAGGWGQGDRRSLQPAASQCSGAGGGASFASARSPDCDSASARCPTGSGKPCQLAWRATAVNPRGPHREEAFLFLRYLASRDYCEQINRSADANAPVEQYCRTPLFLHDPQHPDEDYNRLWITEMAVARSFEQSPFVNPFVSDRILQTHTDTMRNGLETPEQALRAAAAEINAQIARALRKDERLRARYAEAQAREREVGVGLPDLQHEIRQGSTTEPRRTRRETRREPFWSAGACCPLSSRELAPVRFSNRFRLASVDAKRRQQAALPKAGASSRTPKGNAHETAMVSR